MNTLQNERKLQTHSCTKKICRGVCPIDLLPTVEYPESYVVNTDPSSSSAKHRVAMFFNDEESGKYFDSYGLHSIVHSLEAFMDSYFSSWIYNSKTLQSLISHVCGLYTVHYILFRSCCCFLAEILSHFLSDVVLNDKTVERFVENLLK